MIEKIKEAIGVKPYYENENGALYCADCLDILPKIPSESIDLVLTDPPYGIGFKYNSVKEVADNPNDYWGFLKPIYEMLFLLSKQKTALWIWQTTKNLKYLWDWFGDDIRIYISCKNFVQLRKTYLNYAYDVIVVKQKGIITQKFKPKNNLDYFVSNTASIVSKPNNKERQHPCPRPLDQVIRIVENFTQKDHIVLDPFLGSGTTAVACESLGRKWIGIELSEKYCEIAKQRINDCSLNLF